MTQTVECMTARRRRERGGHCIATATRPPDGASHLFITDIIHRTAAPAPYDANLPSLCQAKAAQSLNRLHGTVLFFFRVRTERIETGGRTLSLLCGCGCDGPGRCCGAGGWPQHVNHSMTRHGSCASSSASRSACTSLCWAQPASMRALHSAHKLALVHSASFETEATVWRVWSRFERLTLKLKEPQVG